MLKHSNGHVLREDVTMFAARMCPWLASLQKQFGSHSHLSQLFLLGDDDICEYRETFWLFFALRTCLLFMQPSVIGCSQK